MDIELPVWYESTQGPGLSKTLIYIASNILPMLNMMLAAKGINLLPEAINFWISLAVFIGISIKAGLSYIIARKNLAAKILTLQGQVKSLGGKI